MKNGDSRYLVSSVGRRFHAGSAVVIIRFDVTITVSDVRAIYLEFSHAAVKNVTCFFDKNKKKWKKTDKKLDNESRAVD